MTTLLFGVITGPTFNAAAKALTKAKPFIQGVELRLDYFEEFDLEELKTFLHHCDLPVMLTLRPKEQGGYFQGSEKKRLELLEAFGSLNPAYIDLEFDVPQAFRKKLFEAYPNISFLSSYHDFSQTPEDLESLYALVKTPYAHIYKIAVTAHSTLDALKVLHFVQSKSKHDKMIGIAMGELGQPSRILAPVVGSFLTYAPLDVEHLTAPGQLTAEELQKTYRFPQLNRQTQILSLIGDPVQKSLGALIHNAVFEDANLNAVYIKMPLKKEELSAFFALSARLPFKGFSVTMPHKENVLPYLAKTMNACNTIDVIKGHLLGHNTDGRGALNAIEKRGKVKDKHIVFIGAGGAAKALILEAKARRAHVTIINRTPEKAIAMANLCNGRGGGWELFPEICRQGYDVIVNCIPEGEEIEQDWILPGKIAMDIVYVPKNTPFLIKAAQQNCQLIFGYEMFAEQAVMQEEIWFPNKIDLDKAFEIIERILSEKLSLI